MVVPDRQPRVLSLSLTTLYITSSLSAGVTLLISVFISLLFYFEASNGTECDDIDKKAINYLPSVSAAISRAVPQAVVWRISFGLLFGTHFMMVYFNYVHYSNLTPKYHSAYSTVVKMAATAAFLEKCGLVGVTYIPSTENNEVHTITFVMHTGGTITQMILYLIIIKWSHDWIPLQGKMRRYYNHKFYTFLFNMSLLIVCVYCYNRHNTYCEDLVYTVFAACEYLVIFSNIYFHLLDGLYLFSDQYLTLDLPQPIQLTENHEKVY